MSFYPSDYATWPNYERDSYRTRRDHRPAASSSRRLEQAVTTVARRKKRYTDAYDAYHRLSDDPDAGWDEIKAARDHVAQVRKARKAAESKLRRLQRREQDQPRASTHGNRHRSRGSAAPQRLSPTHNAAFQNVSIPEASPAFAPQEYERAQKGRARRDRHRGRRRDEEGPILDPGFIKHRVDGNGFMRIDTDAAARFAAHAKEGRYRVNGRDVYVHRNK